MVSGSRLFLKFARILGQQPFKLKKMAILKIRLQDADVSHAGGGAHLTLIAIYLIAIYLIDLSQINPEFP